jgi:DNA replication protein DnaC
VQGAPLSDCDSLSPDKTEKEIFLNQFHDMPTDAKDFLSRLGLSLPEGIVAAELRDDNHHGVCDRHGEYPISFRDEHGVIRYRPEVCPICMAEKKSARLMRSAAIPKRHQECRFENYEIRTDEQKDIFDVCKEYAETFREKAFQRGDCLIMSGNCGTGKNHLATAIARTVMESGFSVVLTTARGMVARIRESWDRSAQHQGERLTELEAIREFADVDLLIIDEVGKQFAGGKSDEVHLFEVINMRYLNTKPVIVLSNESAKSIESYIGTAAYDRLCENGLLLSFNWQSYRRG